MSRVAFGEQDLILRLGTALLREDVVGLRSRGVLLPVPGPRVAGKRRPQARSVLAWTRRSEADTPTPDRWLALNGLRLPVRIGSPERGDLVSDLVMRRPEVLRVSPRGRFRAARLGSVLRVLETELLTSVAPELAAEFRSGFEALRIEAQAAAAASALRHRHRSAVLGRLHSEVLGRPHPEALGGPRSEELGGLRSEGPGRSGPEGAGYSRISEVTQVTQPSSQPIADPPVSSRVGGPCAGPNAEPVGTPASFWLTAESLAAHHDHPIYPLSIARVGLHPTDLPRWAPEHAPRFGLRWVSVPREHVTAGGELPTWWPGDNQAIAFPVHPAMTRDFLAEAVKDVPWQPFPAPRLQVRPTLSMRTVVPESDPSVHLKVPLPMRTLGRLNLRLVSQASLADGAVLTRSLQALLRQDFGDTVLTADESTWLHADRRLAVLVRRWPEMGEAKVVPVAGLTARSWDGRLLIQVLADEFYGGDLDAFLEVYLRRLLTWQLALWLGYGIVHEAHPQNVLVAVDHQNGLRLLLRDLDSCLVDPDLAEAALGADAPDGLADHRLVSKDPVDLAAMFVTTTLHQCVASVLIETATGLNRPVAELLSRVRPLLSEIAEAHPEARDRALLISGVIQAERLPVKRTLTAATLLPKSRTGAADVNKFYGADAPSYL